MFEHKKMNAKTAVSLFIVTQLLSSSDKFMFDLFFISLLVFNIAFLENVVDESG